MSCIVIYGKTGGVENIIHHIRETSATGLKLLVYEHADVFRTVLPDKVDVIWITIDSVLDVEAARQLRRVYPQAPLIIVGSDYMAALKAVELGAIYYLDRNAGADEVTEALQRIWSEVQYGY